MGNDDSRHDQLKELYSRHHASNEKFDYFMVTLAGGLFAYIAQTFSPDKLPLTSALTTFGSLLTLIASFYCGLKRIQIHNSATRLNQRFIECDGDISKRVKSLHQYTEEEEMGVPFTCKNDLGEIYNKQRFEQEIMEFRDKMKGIESKLDVELKLVIFYGWIRDKILFLGFILITIAKILQWLPTLKHA